MKIKKRVLLPVLLIGGVFAGPRADFPALVKELPKLGVSILELDNYIQEKERKIENLKPDNEAQIVWADSVRKTPFSIVYLHGWSASQEEGDPIHEELAKKYGCNLYLSRLAGHGIDSKDSFLKLSPKDLLESAKEALLIGNLIGEKVILMSCSTGGTLSIYLAAEYPELVHAQMLYSPNIHIYSSTTKLLTGPWGSQLGHALIGNYRSFDRPQEIQQYWTTTYRMEGLICLQKLLDETMKPDIWSKVTQPLFLGYYFKNEEEQDKTVSVEAMLEFYENVLTPAGLKRKVAFPDVGGHVVLSRMRSKDLPSVRKETFAYVEEVLGLVAKQ